MIENEFGITIIIAILCLVLGGFCGAEIRDSRWETQTISRGYAEYNQTNGVFQWKDK